MGISKHINIKVSLCCSRHTSPITKAGQGEEVMLLKLSYCLRGRTVLISVLEWSEPVPVLYYSCALSKLLYLLSSVSHKPNQHQRLCQADTLTVSVNSFCCFPVQGRGSLAMVLSCPYDHKGLKHKAFTDTHLSSSERYSQSCHVM